MLCQVILTETRLSLAPKSSCKSFADEKKWRNSDVPKKVVHVTVLSLTLICLFQVFWGCWSQSALPVLSQFLLHLILARCIDWVHPPPVSPTSPHFQPYPSCLNSKDAIFLLLGYMVWFETVAGSIPDIASSSQKNCHIKPGQKRKVLFFELIIEKKIVIKLVSH